MNTCEFSRSAAVELYFYDELAADDRVRVESHLRGCDACRQRLGDLQAIGRALADAPVVDAPAAAQAWSRSGSPANASNGDWSGFMHRLEDAVGLTSAPTPRALLEHHNRTWRVRQLMGLAAMLAIVVAGVFLAARARHRSAPVVAHRDPAAAPAAASAAPAFDSTPVAALREISAEHLERSKLVVLGLATRNPHTTSAADWQFERQLAGTLLSDTRLYRLAAQQQGVSDVAHVMRDLETVLLEASMSDGSDRDSLERVQRLIARRGLVSQMQVVTTAAGL